MTVRLVSLGSAVAIAAAAWFSSGALASSVTNHDTEVRQFTIIEGGQQNQFSIKPGERIDKVCQRGCILRLDGIEDGQYVLSEGTEIVSIEDKVLYYDGAEKRLDEEGVENQAPGK